MNIFNSKAILDKREEELDDGIYLNIKGDGWVLSATSDKLAGTLIPPGNTALIEHSLAKDETQMFYLPTNYFTDAKISNILRNTLDLDFTSLPHENKTLTYRLQAKAPEDKYLYMFSARTYIRYDIIKVQGHKIKERAVVYRESMGYAKPYLFNQNEKLNNNNFFDNDYCLMNESRIILPAIETSTNSSIVDGLTITLPTNNRFYPDGRYIFNKGDGHLRKNDVDFSGGIFLEPNTQCTIIESRANDKILIDRLYRSSNSPYETVINAVEEINSALGGILLPSKENRGYWHITNAESKKKYIKMYNMRNKYELVSITNSKVTDYAILYKQSLGTHKYVSIGETSNNQDIKQETLFQHTEQSIAPSAEYSVMLLDYTEVIKESYGIENSNTTNFTKLDKPQNLLFSVISSGYYNIKRDDGKSLEIYKLLGPGNRNMNDNSPINKKPSSSNKYKGLKYIIGDRTVQRNGHVQVYLEKNTIYCVKALDKINDYSITVSKNTANLTSLGDMAVYNINVKNESDLRNIRSVNNGQSISLLLIGGEASKRFHIQTTQDTSNSFRCKLFKATTVGIDTSFINILDSSTDFIIDKNTTKIYQLPQNGYYLLNISLDPSVTKPSIDFFINHL